MIPKMKTVTPLHKSNAKIVLAWAELGIILYR